jgi:hypothetical protein
MTRIQEIQERLDNTIPAPWHRIGFEISKPEVDIVTWSYAELPPAEWEDADERAGRVLDFIAHARDDIPWLLEQVAVLEKALETAPAMILTVTEYEDWYVNVCYPALNASPKVPLEPPAAEGPQT